MTQFDLIIIGAGPGGYTLALRQARQGWKVALIDAGDVGGTCLNRGCIPTKAMLASAKGLHFLKNAWKLGLTVETVGFSWEKVLIRKNEIVGQLQAGIEKLLTSAGITRLTGKATLHAGNRVTIAGSEIGEIAGKKICLAVGSIPGVPQAFIQESTILWTSDDALNAPEIPESLLVIGGGVIGLELGQVFSEFGSKVTIVEMMPQILPSLDSATAKRLQAVFRKAGLEILVGHKVEALDTQGAQVNVRISGQERVFHKALLAIGREPNLSCLRGSEVKLNLDGKTIAVNERFETSEPGVYAIGDAIKGPMLAHKAAYDAEILSRQWGGQPVTPNYAAVPSCVYTYPEIAWVGVSEEEAQRLALPYKVGRFLFSANGRALAMGEGEGVAKVILGNDGMPLGTILWGPEVSNLIIEPTILQGLGISEQRFETIIHPHPTLSEVYAEAFENALGRNIHG